MIPSYKTGYARNVSESANPGLWPAEAWIPALGNTGTVLREATGREAGALNGDAVFMPTEKGTALDGEGTGFCPITKIQRISTYFNNSPYSFVTLVRSDVAATRGVLFGDWRSNGSQQSLALAFESDGKLSYEWRDSVGNQSIASTSSYAAGEWVHVAGTWDGVTCTLYINGKSENSKASGDWPDQPVGNQQMTVLRAGAFSGSYLNGCFSSLMMFSRALKLNQIEQLYVDPLAPFRRRISIPYKTEAPQPTTGTGVIRVKSYSQPSYKTGYARNAGESANPGLWGGLVGAWVPALGQTGSTLFDVSGNHNHGTLTNMDPGTAWGTTESTALTFDGVNDYVATGLNLNGYSGAWTISATCRTISGADFNPIASAGDSGLAKMLLFTIEGTDVYMRINGGYVYATVANIDDDNSHNVLVTYDGTFHDTGLNIWVDGTKQSLTTSGRRSLTIGQYDLQIAGRTWDPLYGTGKIYSLTFWKQQLADGAIQQLHADPLAPFRRRISIPYKTEAPQPTFNPAWAKNSNVVLPVI